MLKRLVGVLGSVRAVVATMAATVLIIAVSATMRTQAQSPRTVFYPEAWYGYGNMEAYLACQNGGSPQTIIATFVIDGYGSTTISQGLMAGQRWSLKLNTQPPFSYFGGGIFGTRITFAAPGACSIVLRPTYDPWGGPVQIIEGSSVY